MGINPLAPACQEVRVLPDGGEGASGIGACAAAGWPLGRHRGPCRLNDMRSIYRLGVLVPYFPTPISITGPRVSEIGVSAVGIPAGQTI
jgi:hypothetical protein